MKHLLAVFLLAPYLAFLLPLFAQTTEAAEFSDSYNGAMLLCPFANTEYTVKTNLTGADKKASEAEEAEKYSTWETQFKATYASKLTATTCGKANSYTGYIEKGDCAADPDGDGPLGGKVVTEISEVVGPQIEPDANGNQIINLYAGSCCLVQEKDENGNALNCKDQRTLYTDDLAKCTASTDMGGISVGKTGLQNCERRQWVIGSSGAGLVQILVKQIYTWGAFSVGGIAVMTIILQGVRISASGVSGDITESKNKILQAIAGIVLLFLSSLILYTINPQFFS